MIYLKLTIITVLFFKCLAHSDEDYRPPSKSESRTTPKNIIHSVLDTFLNVIHPVNLSLDKEEENFPQNVIWQIENEQDNTEEDTNETTPDGESLVFAEEIRDVADSPPSEGFVDPYEDDSNKNFRPIIPGLIQEPGVHNVGSAHSEKSTRKPLIKLLKFRPKLNISKIVARHRTTTTTRATTISSKIEETWAFDRSDFERASSSEPEKYIPYVPR